MIEQSIYERLELARDIAADLAGTATPDQREKLARWLDASPRNRDEYDRIREAALCGEYPTMERETLARHWALFDKKARGTGHIVKKRVLRAAKYAAAVVVLCVAGYYIWNRTDTPHEAMPQKKVSLLLEDGSTLMLEREASRLISRNEGVTIAVEDSTLVYSSLTEAAEADDAVGTNTLIVPNGCDYRLRLSDGSEVWLNAGSTLTFPTVFGGARREVGITGEGYFEVSPDARHPFVVKAGEVEITVLGTSFNVCSFSRTIETTLVEGKVRLSYGDEQLVLYPDQQAVWHAEAEKFDVRPVDARNYTLWKEGVFWFDDAPLSAIMDEVCRWYDMQAEFRNPALAEMRFSVEIKRYESVDTVLGIIGGTKRAGFRRDGDKIEIY